MGAFLVIKCIKDLKKSAKNIFLKLPNLERFKLFVAKVLNEF